MMYINKYPPKSRCFIRKPVTQRCQGSWLLLSPVAARSINFSSVQSLDRLGRPRDMADDSAEILFQSFLQEAPVSSSGMGRDVHSLMFFIQHFLCRPRRPGCLEGSGECRGMWHARTMQISVAWLLPEEVPVDWQGSWFCAPSSNIPRSFLMHLVQQAGSMFHSRKGGSSYHCLTVLVVLVLVVVLVFMLDTPVVIQLLGC